ncbi:MAG: hypothetical protein OXH68_03410 [Gammaproteobacteria bacterium]|nr:hypothetical protein [Gammaproteobacteria bacterium]
MPFITKAARAATLEAAGVTDKIDALRRELTAAIQRAEDHMREELRAMRAESAADRQAMFALAEGFRTDAANDRRDAANDRQAMLDIAERIRKDSETDRQAMMALAQSAGQAR